MSHLLNGFGTAPGLKADGVIATGPLLGEPYPLGQFREALARCGGPRSQRAKHEW